MIPDTNRPDRDGLCLSDAESDPARHGARGDGVRRRADAHHRKAFHSMVCNRLRSSAMKTSTRSPRRRSCRSSRRRSQQSRERYSKSIGEARLMVGNASASCARAPKSRAGCHFAAAIGLRSHARRLRADNSRLGQRSAHDDRARRWAVVSITSAGGREADPAADR